MRNRILLVDDEPAWIRTVALFLKLSGYNVLTAARPNQALRHARGGELGAIILDVNLAGEDTARLMERLKAKHPEAPVILYTSLEQYDERVHQLIDQGADYYLHKGNLKDLLNCLLEISQKFGSIQSGSRLALAGAWQVV